MKKNLIIVLALIVFISCTASKQKNEKEAEKMNIPTFSSDSAYLYIEHQTNFGPRVPNSSAHAACQQYLSHSLKRFGAEVIIQQADLQAFDGTILHAANIIGSFSPAKENRILLFAHWDSRPWADNDPEPANRRQPVLGADDGASGVGVLLEIARQLGQQLPNIGVDIIFFDAEDYGNSQSFQNENTNNSWCLGSQYWAEHPHKQNYQARFGILLDMVGASQSLFYKEYFSLTYAPRIVSKVWTEAKNLGFGQYFIDQQGGAITDDHFYVNNLRGIPSIDIIHYDPNSATGFPPYWHTLHDTMENIDKNTLLAVGTTLLHIIYNEK